MSLKYRTTICTLVFEVPSLLHPADADWSLRHEEVRASGMQHDSTRQATRTHWLPSFTTGVCGQSIANQIN